MTRSHQMDIYGAWIHAVPNLKSWKRLARSIDADLPKPHSLGLTSMVHKGDGTIHLAIFIHTKMIKGNTLGQVEIITHESTHAATMLLDTIGESYDGDSESLAYLVGWMAAWIWDATISQAKASA